MKRVEDLLEFRIDSYSPETRFKTKVDGVLCEIHYFGGSNKSEFEIVYNDGRHRLFNNGMIQMEWTEVGGKKTGTYTVFEFGYAKYMGKWESLNNAAEVPHIVNLKKGKILEIINRKNGIVVYRGGYTKSLLRHGLGMEYNKDSGDLIGECLWQNGKKMKCLKEFIGDKMIEYSNSSSNLTPILKKTMYYGGYSFVESTGVFLRHGVGYEISSDTGYATQEGVWEFGKKVSSVDLDNGWYDVSATSNTKKEPVAKTKPEVKEEEESKAKAEVKEEEKEREAKAEVKEEEKESEAKAEVKKKEPEAKAEVKKEEKSEPQPQAEAKKESESKPEVNTLSKKQRKKLAKQEQAKQEQAKKEQAKKEQAKKKALEEETTSFVECLPTVESPSTIPESPAPDETEKASDVLSGIFFDLFSNKESDTQSQILVENESIQEPEQQPAQKNRRRTKKSKSQEENQENLITLTSEVVPSPDNLTISSNEPKVSSGIDDDPFFNDLFGDSSLFQPTKVEVSNAKQLKAATSASIIEIQPYSYQEETFNLTSFHVKELTIAERACSLVTEFQLCSLPSLKVLTIEKNCFISNTKQGGNFSISDCPSLESIDIGHACFYRYEKFQIERCDKLRSLKIGELTHESMCFQNVSLELSGRNKNSFFIVDLPALSEVVLGRRSFRNASSITFSSRFVDGMNKSRFALSRNDYAGHVLSERRNEIKLVGDAKYAFRFEFHTDLPALRSVQSDGNSFSMISRACFEGTTSQSIRIRYSQLYSV